MIEAEEERARIPLSSCFVNDSVYRRHKVVISLSHKAVRDVYDDAAWYRLGFDPVAGFGEDFETSLIVLRNEGEAFEVGMRADT